MCSPESEYSQTCSTIPLIFCQHQSILLYEGLFQDQHEHLLLSDPLNLRRVEMMYFFLLYVPSCINMQVTFRSNLIILKRTMIALLWRRTSHPRRFALHTGSRSLYGHVRFKLLQGRSLNSTTQWRIQEIFFTMEALPKQHQDSFSTSLRTAFKCSLFSCYA